MAPLSAVRCSQSGKALRISFIVVRSSFARLARWRIAACSESDGCCASWSSGFYYDHVSFVINSGYAQDSRRVAQAATPTGGQGHALIFTSHDCFALSFTALFCLSLSFNRLFTGFLLCGPFWQPACASRWSAPAGPERHAGRPTRAPLRHKAFGRVYFIPAQAFSKQQTADYELRPRQAPLPFTALF